MKCRKTFFENLYKFWRNTKEDFEILKYFEDFSWGFLRFFKIFEIFKIL